MRHIPIFCECTYFNIISKCTYDLGWSLFWSFMSFYYYYIVSAEYAYIKMTMTMTLYVKKFDGVCSLEFECNAIHGYTLHVLYSMFVSKVFILNSILYKYCLLFRRIRFDSAISRVFKHIRFEPRCLEFFQVFKNRWASV